MMKQKTKIRAYYFGRVLRYETERGTDGFVECTFEVNDLSVIDRIKTGPRSLSPDLRIKSFKCSICGQNFDNCEHESGQIYDGKECSALIDEFEVMHVAIVSKPKDPMTMISDMLVIAEENDEQKYTWYGFLVPDERTRFTSINNAQCQGLIPDSAAECFARHFSVNFTGEAVYPNR